MCAIEEKNDTRHHPASVGPGQAYQPVYYYVSLSLLYNLFLSLKWVTIPYGHLHDKITIVCNFAHIDIHTNSVVWTDAEKILYSSVSIAHTYDIRKCILHRRDYTAFACIKKYILSWFPLLFLPVKHYWTDNPTSFLHLNHLNKAWLTLNTLPFKITISAWMNKIYTHDTHIHRGGFMWKISYETDIVVHVTRRLEIHVYCCH